MYLKKNRNGLVKNIIFELNMKFTVHIGQLEQNRIT